MCGVFLGGFYTSASLFYAGGKNNSLAGAPVNMDLNTSVMHAHRAEDRTSLVGKPLRGASPKVIKSFEQILLLTDPFIPQSQFPSSPLSAKQAL